jgi:ribosomal protein L24
MFIMMVPLSVKVDAMNPGDKVVITYGPHKGEIGELVEYRQANKWATQFCRVKVPGFNYELMVDPWDVAPYEEEELNEADAASASNL